MLMPGCDGQNRGARSAHPQLKYGHTEGCCGLPEGGIECRPDERESILRGLGGMSKRDTHLHKDTLRFSALLKWQAFVHKSPVFARESTVEKDLFKSRGRQIDRAVRCQALVSFLTSKGARWRREGKVTTKKKKKKKWQQALRLHDTGGAWRAWC